MRRSSSAFGPEGSTANTDTEGSEHAKVGEEGGPGVALAHVWATSGPEVAVTGLVSLRSFVSPRTPDNGDGPQHGTLSQQLATGPSDRVQAHPSHESL